MDKQKAIEILARYNAGKATSVEIAKMDNWYARENLKQMQKPELEDYERISSEIYTTLAQYPGKRDSALIRKANRKLFFLYKYFGAAAAVATIAYGLYFFKGNGSEETAGANANLISKDIVPGKNTAMLTLSNGKSITLSDAKSGIVVGDDLRYNDNTLITSSVKKNRVDNLDDEEMTLTTPRGGTYQVVLFDGTKVWLNAASSLTYTAGLNKDGVRRIKLIGEAYFEVARDIRHPFIVVTKSQQIEVLGTHFNVNSYNDEPNTSTTLLEGSVKIKTGKIQKVIKPGEQALNSSGVIDVRQVDIDNVVDWKNGDFYLNHIEFKAAMRKIARWYDMEIIYDKTVPDNMESGGWIARDKPLSAVLKSIEVSGLVKFKVEGRKIYVMQ